jgi:ribose/xylose/arabinose/galactoside ABC-type transport system permease subunit
VNLLVQRVIHVIILRVLIVQWKKVELVLAIKIAWGLLFGVHNVFVMCYYHLQKNIFTLTCCNFEPKKTVLFYSLYSVQGNGDMMTLNGIKSK